MSTSKKRSNKGLGIAVMSIVFFVVVICLCKSIKKVPVGYAGVIYNVNGGVKNETIDQGWHLIKPTQKMKLFTVGNEQLLLTKDSREGSKENDSFKVSTLDDASISISFQMSYRFNQASLTDTYRKFKGMDGEMIVENRLKSVLKSKVSEITTNYSMMDIYSGNRAEINSKLTDYLNKSFVDLFGIEVLDASIIDVHPDKKLKEAIDNRVTALQKKQQAQAEQETAKVEAETAMIKAKNASDIKIIKAKADAESNKLISQSITEELIKMKEAEARLEHGWVTVQGASTSAIVTNDADNEGAKK